MNVRTAPTPSEPKLGYTGHQFDVESGLVYARARYYDPALGIFLSRDPVEGATNEAPSLHRYAYVRANPLRYVDPTGLCWAIPGSGDASCSSAYWSLQQQMADWSWGLSKSIDSAGGGDSVLQSVNTPFRLGVANWVVFPGDRPGNDINLEASQTLNMLNPVYSGLTHERQLGEIDAEAKRAGGYTLKTGLLAAEKTLDVLVDVTVIGGLAKGAVSGFRASVGVVDEAYVGFTEMVPAPPRGHLDLMPWNRSGSGGRVTRVSESGEMLEDPKLDRPTVVPPRAPPPDEHTYITYDLNNAKGESVYVGRASGFGSPEKVLQDRLDKGHDVFDANPGLTPKVRAQQGNAEANKGAEGVRYEQRLREGGKMLNDPKSPPLSGKPSKAAEVRAKIDAYAEDLKKP